MQTENEIRAVLGPRLEAATSRKEKTRAAATVLFFEFGIYPSAKTVHSYTQQGSMTDITADLREFWAEIREKSRVQLDSPSLPAELLEGFGQGLSQMWELAMEKATASFDDARKESLEKVEKAEQERTSAQEANAALQADLQALESDLGLEREKRFAADSLVVALGAQVDELRESLAKAEGQTRAAEQARQAAQERFSEDLEAERMARQRDKEAMQGEINFAKMQIEAARASEREARERAKADLASRDVEVATYRQRLSKAELALDELRVLAAQLQGKVLTLEGQLATAAAAAAADKAARQDKSPEWW